MDNVKAKRDINSFTITVKEEDLKKALGLSKEECEDYMIEEIVTDADGNVAFYFCH